MNERVEQLVVECVAEIWPDATMPVVRDWLLVIGVDDVSDEYGGGIRWFRRSASQDYAIAGLAHKVAAWFSLPSAVTGDDRD